MAVPARAGATQGPPTLFEQLYDEYHTSIYNHLYRMVSEREMALDLTQETFLKAFRALPAMPDVFQYRPWLYRIATNTAYDALRKKRLIQWQSLDEMEFEPADRDDADPQVAVHAAEPGVESEIVHRALARLSARHRSALLLVAQDQLTFDEIATVLQAPRHTIKFLLSRARSAFRVAMRELETEAAL